MTDCLLVHLPRYVHFSDPPIAIAYLHSYLKINDVNSEILDLSLDWYRRVEGNDAIYKEIDSWFMLHNKESALKYEKIGRIFGNVLGQPFGEGSTGQTKFDDDLQLNLDSLSSEGQIFLNSMVKDWVIQIMKNNPRVLGLSLFSYNSLKICKLLILGLKLSNFSGKIAIGGPGVLPVREKLKEMVDYYIIGPGELPLLEILNKTSNITLDCHYPDYSNFNFKKYNSQKSIRITGSRGCIKRCNFCDIYKQWPKFISRDGRDIANEMILQNQTLDIHPSKFFFTDSLLNGNPASLRMMCKHLIKNNTKFEWEGQFIATSPKFFTETDYKLMAAAGCTRVSFGIESGSANVRLSMNKKQKDSDIEFCINQLHKNNIEQVWLIIVGFPTETITDYIQTLELFYKHKDLNKIKPIQCGLAEFRPDDGTDWQIAEHNNIIWQSTGGWVWKNNPLNDLEERKLRLLYLESRIIQWGYIHRAQNSPFADESSQMYTLNNLYGAIDFSNLENQLPTHLLA